MFEDVGEKYQMTGAKEEFFQALKQGTEPFEPYLSRDYLCGVNTEWLGLGEEALGALLDAAAQMLKHTELLEFASSARDLIFDDQISVDYLAWLGFPRPHSGGRRLDAFFGLLVHLSGIETVKKRYEKRGIPLSVMRASYRSVRIWISSFKSFYGYYGHDRECPRMLYVENFRFIRIGRLEFEPRCFYGQAVALRNRTDGRLRLLASGGTVFRADGKADGTNEIYDPYSMTAFYAETDERVTGCEIVDGRIRSETVTLPKRDWEVVLRPGDPCINSHIPRDGRLDIGEAGASFDEAEKFFRTYFPEIPFRFFQCHSWLLDDVYASLLGPESNIVRFQKLFTSFPERSGDLGAMISVFTEVEFCLKDWVPVTGLQRKLKEYYEQGGTVCNGGGIRPVSGLRQKQKCVRE